ncbi:MAG: polysaccharide biosynthesis tyrosine autokinase [Actinomycetaceae bacterium]|nr:polysaccharide biosynthesis tyrosine autokinase [Actinomycetaceae bacterium]
MTVGTFFRILSQHILAIVLIIIVSVTAGIGLFLTTPKQYQANGQAILNVLSSQDNVLQAASAAALAQSKAKAYQDLFQSLSVMKSVSEKVEGAPSPSDLISRTGVTLSPGGLTYNIVARSTNPGQARDIVEQTIEATSKQVRKIEGASGRSPSVEVVSLSEVAKPVSPYAPKLYRYITFSFIIGVILAIMFAVLRSALDTKVRSMRDVNKRYSSPVLGEIPSQKIAKNQKIDIRSSNVASIYTESLRKVRTNLQFANVDEKLESILMTSSVQGEGKTTISVNLARIIAQDGRKTILVDADLRRPTVHQYFGYSNNVGLSTVLSGQVNLADAIHTTNDPNLLVLPSGSIPPNPAELLGSKRMTQIVEVLSRDYFVIIDGAPINPVTDSTLLGAKVDGVLLVVALGKVTKEALQSATSTLTQVQLPLLGFILNKSHEVQEGTGKYGGYYVARNDYNNASREFRSMRPHASDIAGFPPHPSASQREEDLVGQTTAPEQTQTVHASQKRIAVPATNSFPHVDAKPDPWEEVIHTDLPGTGVEKPMRSRLKREPRRHAR